jgi:oligopeptide/dipeptide ABC transporter ATP-binding protein
MPSTTQAAETAGDLVFQVNDATVSFDVERGVSRVLDSVSINIYENEILGIVGESGSGKSMFASALLDAVVEPGVLTGEILYQPADSEPVDLVEASDRQIRTIRWEQIAMVFQGAMSSFNPTSTIEKHFRETLRDHDRDVVAGMERADDILTDLYLDPERMLSSYPHELSGGMQQRALIALSLILEPNVLVMDEPTAALDLLMQRAILSMIADIKEKYDLTVVFITHDLPLIAKLADRLAVMYAFDFVEVGTAREMVFEPAHPYTRALLNSTPNLEAHLDQMRPIEGNSPDPVDSIQGCSYNPRCPLADSECESLDPPFETVSSTHRTACHHWRQTDEKIPLNTKMATREDQG